MAEAPKTVDDYTPEELEVMSPEEIEALDTAGENEQQDPPPAEDAENTDGDKGKDDPPPAEDASKSGESDKVSEESENTDGTTAADDKAEGEDQGKEGEEGEEVTLQKRFSDTRSALTKTQQENAELKRRLEDLEREQKLQKLDKPGFKKLTAEEQEALKYEDPDAYVQYRLDEKEQKDNEQERHSLQQQTEQARENYVAQQNVSNLLSVAIEATGVDYDPNSDKEPPQELVDFLQSDTLKKVDQLVVSDFRPDKDGVFSRDQIKRAYQLVTRDEDIAKAQAKGGINTVESIKKAANGTPALNRAPKGAKANTVKKLEDYTQQEIEQMGESELMKLEIEEEGV